MISDKKRYCSKSITQLVSLSHKDLSLFLSLLSLHPSLSSLYQIPNRMGNLSIIVCENLTVCLQLSYIYRSSLYNVPNNFFR